MSSEIIKVPDIGDSTDVEIIEIAVSEGDVIEPEDNLINELDRAKNRSQMVDGSSPLFEMIWILYSFPCSVSTTPPVSSSISSRVRVEASDFSSTFSVGASVDSLIDVLYLWLLGFVLSCDDVPHDSSHYDSRDD